MFKLLFSIHTFVLASASLGPISLGSCPCQGTSQHVGCSCGARYRSYTGCSEPWCECHAYRRSVCMARSNPCEQLCGVRCKESFLSSQVDLGHPVALFPSSYSVLPVLLARLGAWSAGACLASCTVPRRTGSRWTNPSRRRTGPHPKQGPRAGHYRRRRLWEVMIFFYIHMQVKFILLTFVLLVDVVHKFLRVGGEDFVPLIALLFQPKSILFVCHLVARPPLILKCSASCGWVCPWP